MAKVVFDSERCKGCELCIEFCPKKIIRISAGTNSKGYHPAEIMDEARCTGCAACAMMCPDTVIEVYR